jgi:hypothetical protein
VLSAFLSHFKPDLGLAIGINFDLGNETSYGQNFGEFSRREENSNGVPLQGLVTRNAEFQRDVTSSLHLPCVISRCANSSPALRAAPSGFRPRQHLSGPHARRKDVPSRGLPRSRACDARRDIDEPIRSSANGRAWSQLGCKENLVAVENS